MPISSRSRRVAARAAVACRAVVLYRTASEQARASQALLDLGEALGAQTGVEGVAGMLAAAADRLVECAAVSVWLRDGDRMRVAATRGYTPDESDAAGDLAVDPGDALFTGALDRRDLTIRPAVGHNGHHHGG